MDADETLSHSNPQTRTAKAPGTSIVFDTVGNGPDVIFLHAGIADRTMWKPQVELLQHRYRCTTPDARGFGDTPIGSEPFSRRDDLVAVMEAINAKQATVIGCSIGAGFALDFALEHPHLVDKLILVGVTPNGFEGEDDGLLLEMWPRIDDAIAAGEYEKAGRLEARLWVDGPRRPEGSAPSWLRDQVVEWSLPINQVKDWGDSRQLEPPAMARLGHVTVPTLVIVGTEDANVVIEGSRATAAGIPGARLEELEGTAHLPNLEVPDAFNRALVVFLG